MSDLNERGTLAVATVYGRPNVRVFRTDDPSRPWITANCEHRRDDEVTDVRPLVVLDPEDAEQVERLTKAFVDSGVWRVIPVDVDAHAYRREQIKAAIEALTLPPKPPEPTGLGAVVESGNGDRWVRIEAGGGKDALFLWVCEADEDAKPRPWSSVNAVRVLSEGVSS